MRLYAVCFLTLLACDGTCGGRQGSTGRDATAALAVPPPNDMVHVPAGPFLMGEPAHEVELAEFWIDRTEVTQGDYDRCVAAGACGAVPALLDIGLPPPRYPVVNVTWNDAAAYCAWVEKQLPTEAQWEKAARGVDGRTYPWGEDPPTCERALFERWTPEKTDACGEKDPYTATHPVGSHPSGASPYGALDMAGNVLEWTASEEPHYRVVRGDRTLGNVNTLRVAYRKPVGESPVSPEPHFQTWNNRHRIIGFRCVRMPREREVPR
ncbi:MAG: formylglycine-generating enzyme family protein [Myxococcota bacterium]|nr:formylglycine-generating enzyme family protein [Myxococcota bacterium]